MRIDSREIGFFCESVRANQFARDSGPPSLLIGLWQVTGGKSTRKIPPEIKKSSSEQVFSEQFLLGS